MALPVGVTTATCTVGVPVSFSGGPVRSNVTVKPSAFLVHTATGTPLVDMMESVYTTDGVAGQFVLPHTDQSGFQDENGNAYSNWYYTVTVQYSNDFQALVPKTKVFQLVAGQVTVDLDKLPGGVPALPYIAPIATLTSFGGRTGAVTLQEADLPTRLSDAELSATFVPKWKATTAYLAGDKVLSPAGDVVSAKVNFTSGASYNAANWDLSASYSTPADVTAAVAPKLAAAGTKTTTEAGVFDWQNNSTSGYLVHARTGALSTSAVAAMAIGTDLGAGNGLLISHKNTGIGILATGQPGSGRIAEFTSRGSGSGHWINVQAGGAPAQVNARDGAGYPDGVANGTTTFTSATAAFTGADVGAAIVQLTSRGDTDPFGCIPSGTTIASVTNATTVVLSQASTASGTAVMFNIAGRLPAFTQALFRIMGTDLTTEIAKFTRGGATLSTVDVASTPLRVNAKSGQTADIFSAYDGSAVKTFSIVANGGLSAAVLSTFSNAALLGAGALVAQTYSSHGALKAGRAGSGTGDNFWAMGSGSTALSRFNKDGYFMTAKTAAPADADVNTGEAAIWFDSTNGAAKLMIKAKQADGTVKTGSVTLA
jgi:hypothetical protein